MSRIEVNNPLRPADPPSRLFVAMADPVEEKVLHMVTADPARTPTFTPFAAGRLLPERLVGDTLQQLHQLTA